MLSGGERGRLALAKLALQDYNLLLLDEPTNHLDLPSQESCRQSCLIISGTILLVSHDRYLIDALATQIWEVTPDDRLLKQFNGTYSEYKSYLNAGAASLPQLRVEKENNTETVKAKKSITSWKRQKLLADVEKRIAETEKALTSISQQLANPPNDTGKVQQLGSDYVRIEKEHAHLMDEWGALIEE